MPAQEVHLQVTDMVPPPAFLTDLHRPSWTKHPHIASYITDTTDTPFVTSLCNVRVLNES